jgi:hypothetical protein
MDLVPRTLPSVKSIWDTLTRRRVRRVCCSPVFPSVLSLGSTSSAPIGGQAGDLPVPVQRVYRLGGASSAGGGRGSDYSFLQFQVQAFRAYHFLVFLAQNFYFSTSAAVLSIGSPSL